MPHIITTTAAVLVGAAIYLVAAAMTLVGADPASHPGSDAQSSELHELIKRAGDLPVQEIEGLF